MILLEALRHGALVVDGAMGTELLARGVPFDACLEELCLSRPELVRAVHGEYVRAGAQVIETNTFGANAVRLARHGLEDDIVEINAAAVAIAREAIGDRGFVAGAMGPTGLVIRDPSHAERGVLGETFAEQADALASAGVDAILLETMRWPEEIEIAIGAIRRATSGRLPLIVSMALDWDELADERPVAEIAPRLRDLGADVLGVNCCDNPDGLLTSIDKLAPLGVPLIAMSSAGLPTRRGAELEYELSSEQLIEIARRLHRRGVKLIGGCCGVGPAIMKRIALALLEEGGPVDLAYGAN